MLPGRKSQISPKSFEKIRQFRHFNLGRISRSFASFVSKFRQIFLAKIAKTIAFLAKIRQFRHIFGLNRGNLAKFWLIAKFRGFLAILDPNFAGEIAKNLIATQVANFAEMAKFRQTWQHCKLEKEILRVSVLNCCVFRKKWCFYKVQSAKKLLKLNKTRWPSDQFLEQIKATLFQQFFFNFHLSIMNTPKKLLLQSLLLNSKHRH